MVCLYLWFCSVIADVCMYGRSLRKESVHLTVDPGGEGGGTPIYELYMGMYRCEGYDSQAV